MSNFSFPVVNGPQSRVSTGLFVGRCQKGSPTYLCNNPFACGYLLTFIMAMVLDNVAYVAIWWAAPRKVELVRGR